MSQAISGLEHVPKQIDLSIATEFAIALPDSSIVVCATLHSLVDSSTVQCKITASGQGEYVVSVMPTCRGRHKLRITSDDVEIEGSPVSVLVRCDPQLLGRPVRVIEGVNRPAGMAVRGNTELVVTEMEPAAVTVRDRQGKVIRSFGQELDNPYGVAVGSEGCVYVAELINCKIHKFTSDGGVLKAVGGDCDGSGSGGLIAFPAGISVSQNNHIFVCDDTNLKVHVFDKNLDFLFSFGESGECPGQFQSPSDLAFDSDGNIFVADTKREKIIKFSPRGEFLSEFAMKGQSSELELGVCVGPGDEVYVSDFWNHRVMVYDATGRFVTTFGTKGSEPGQFDTPAGIAVDADGYIYVCDQTNNRIQVF